MSVASILKQMFCWQTLVALLAVIVLATLTTVTLCYVYDDCSNGTDYNIETRMDRSRK